jgi:hypothetical protein
MTTWTEADAILAMKFVLRKPVTQAEFNRIATDPHAFVEVRNDATGAWAIYSHGCERGVTEPRYPNFHRESAFDPDRGEWRYLNRHGQPCRQRVWQLQEERLSMLEGSTYD